MNQEVEVKKQDGVGCSNHARILSYAKDHCSLMGEQANAIVYETLEKLFERESCDKDFGTVLRGLEMEDLDWQEHFYRHLTNPSASTLLKIVETLHENVDFLRFRDYAVVVQVFNRNLKWISPDLSLNMLLATLESQLDKPSVLINFSRFISEVVIDYDGALPSQSDWVKEIQKGDCFDLSASMVFPLMFETEPVYNNRYYRSYNYIDLKHFRESLEFFEL